MLQYLYLINRSTLLSSPMLAYRAIALVVYLEKKGVKCRITKFLRKKKTAHRWSTAHHIVHGKITLGALRSLRDGKDSDGNLWYRQEWDGAYANSESARISESITSNAIQLGAPGTPYAEEGYAINDPRRLPNLQEVPISGHVYGLAIDILVEWEKLGGPWSEEANIAVAKFGLVRPREDEPWHFELERHKRMVNFSHPVVPPGRILIWLLRYFFTRRAQRN